MHDGLSHGPINTKYPSVSSYVPIGVFSVGGVRLSVPFVHSSMLSAAEKFPSTKR